MKANAALLLTALAVGVPTAQAQSIQWQAPLLQDHPLSGKLFNLQTQKPISEQQLIESLRQSPLVLIGEQHDNKDHHQLEQRLLNQLTQTQRKPAVVFEMLDQSFKDRLSHLRQSDQLAVLKTKLDWPEKGWSWQDYGPLFQLTLKNRSPLIAGNIDKPHVMQIYRQGENSLNQPHFNTLQRIKPAVRKTLLDQVEESHCQLMPRQQLKPMVSIQLAKDAQMASAMLNQPNGAVLVAGAFHVNKQLGVPLHLKQYQKGQQYKVLQLVEVEQGKTTLDDYASINDADYLWLTPKQTDKDHCAALRAQMAGKHKKP